MYFSLPSPIDYVKKVNEQFIESGKLINSEKEAEKFKIINPEIRDSYKVNKNIKDINFKLITPKDGINIDLDATALYPLNWADTKLH